MLLSGKSDGTILDQVKSAFEEGFAKIAAENAELRTRANDSFPPIQKVEQCRGLDNISYPSSYEKDGYMRYSHERNPQEIKTHMLGLIEEGKKLNERIHLENLPKIASNKLLIEKLNAFMRQIGMPGTYRERDYSSRARLPKYNTLSAGYTSDITRNISVFDGHDAQKDKEKQILTQINEYVSKKEKEVAEEAVKKKKELDERNKLMGMGQLKGKYNVPIETTDEELLDAILDKNKYLKLGHYLYLNRQDWNDGCSHAERGCDGFNVETTEDADIIQALRGVMGENWDGDGRVFRDSRYGYDYLFGKVPEDLYKDYVKVRELQEEF